MIWGMIAGVLSVVALYLATMYVYFRCRKRFAHCRFAVDAAVIVIALAASVGVRLAVLGASSVSDVPSGFDRVLYVIYSAIGGLTFEGIDTEAAASAGPFLQSLYYGVILYVGLVALSVITARISYEWFSGFQFAVMRLWYRLNGYDIYIFTCVTVNMLLLAKDIVRTYEDARRKKNDRDLANRRCVIIFAGNELEVFDRKNDLHREIVERGYYYHSYHKRRSKSAEPSLLRALGLTGRCGMLRKKGPKDPRICIFAMRQSEDRMGEEAKNSDFVLDDITYSLREYGKRGFRDISPSPKRPWRVIDYYVLTGHDINYEFYDFAIDKRIGEGVKEIVRGCAPRKRRALEEGLSGGIAPVKRMFRLHIVNEAVMSAADLVAARRKKFEAADAASEVAAGKGRSLFLRDIGLGERHDGKNVYRIVLIGFGVSAQHAVHMLFTQTAALDRKGHSSVFIADVYDPEAESKIGLFSSEHPLYRCVDCGADARIGPVGDILNAAHTGRAHEEIYRAYAEETGADAKDARAEVNARLGFPVICFHSVPPVIALFDEIERCALDPGVAEGCGARAVVVCFDDDEANLQVANAVIDAVKHGGGRAAGEVLSLYVYIRDEKNIDRLNWTGEDDAYFRGCGGGLLVIPFGNRESVYSYSGMLDERQAERYHYLYQSLCSEFEKEKHAEREGEMPAGLKWVGEAKQLLSGKTEDAAEWMQSCCRAVEELIARKDERQDIRIKWLEQGPYLRASNSSVHAYSVVFRKYIEEAMRNKTLSCEDILLMAALEKLRWNRFYMAHGWVFGRYPDRSEKAMRRRWRIHDGLNCFGMNDIEYQMYDLINVLYSVQDCAKD